MALRYLVMKRFRGLIILAALVVGWLLTERMLYERTVPPRSVTTFAAFARWQPSPRDIEIIQQGGKDYLLALGPGGGLLPSGPSGYVFDRSGRLVDWSSDTGDDPRFQSKWFPTTTSGTHLNIDSAARWIRSGGGSAAG
jgi:hypothetical protein